MKAATKLSSHEQDELQWFFSSGQTAFERSTMGAMLTHAETYSFDQVQAAMSKRGEDPASIYPHGKITARPTAEVRAVSGYVPDDNLLTRYAVVSRRLRAVSEQWPAAVSVLEAYFGDVGARWGSSERRIFALYPFTAAGRKLLSWTKHKDQVDMPDHERIGVQAQIEKMPGQSKEKRRALLRCAEVQAIELLCEASRVWNEVSK